MTWAIAGGTKFVCSPVEFGIANPVEFGIANPVVLGAGTPGALKVGKPVVFPTADGAGAAEGSGAMLTVRAPPDFAGALDGAAVQPPD